MTMRRIHRPSTESRNASGTPPVPGASAFQTRPFAPPRVQRYTVVQPGDYQAAQQQTMFPGQVLDTTRTTAPAQDRTQVTQNLSWVARESNNPPLKVSEHGQLALESSGQPKVFYATAGAVAANRQRLIDIGSRITLAGNDAKALQVPSNPDVPDGNTVTLVQVEPEKSPGFVNEDELMDTNECDSVSQRIVNGKEVVIGNTAEGFELAGSVSARGGQINHIAAAIHETGPNEEIDEFAQKATLAKLRLPDINNSQLQISEEAQEYFAEGFWRRDHLVPSPQILKVLSQPGVPKSLWEQIYELHVDKSEEERPPQGLVLNHIKKVLYFQGVRNYQQVRNDAARNRRLGVNESAAPEVGESFSIMSQTSPSVIDDDGVFSHDLDVSQMNNEELSGVYRKMLALQTNAERLGALAASQYQRAQGVVPYQEHHAAVVAKDGSDSVTFENYNRSGEEDTLKTELWEQLLQDFEDFDQTVRQNIQQAREAEDSDPISKLNAITRIRKQHLESMRQDFVEVQELTDLKVESNLGENADALWHFNMYGPAHKQQSFHDVWSPSVASAITVRTTGKNDESFAERLVEKVQQRASGLEEHPPAELLNNIFGLIRSAETRIEAADAFRRGLARLADL